MTEPRRPTGPRSYREAGVDPSRVEAVLERIAPRLRATFGDEVLSDLGSFAAAFRWPGDEESVALATIDGVGTKTVVAARCGRWEGIGRDLVAHCANDLAVHGARPLFLLDYLGAARAEPEVFETLLASLAAACRDEGVALLGGESAEMPGVYTPGQIDVVGCMVGVARRAALRTGAGMQPGDVLLGLAATGLHTNGYSLARAVLLPDEEAGARFEPLLGTSRCEALLVPHRSYARSLRRLYDELGAQARGAAHITGGGIAANLRRILAPGCGARLRRDRWPVPALIHLIACEGELPWTELERTFHMGLGMIVCVAPEAAAGAARRLAAWGETVYRVGEIVPGRGEVVLEGRYRPLAPGGPEPIVEPA
ncbi:MAG: phosphoribosylformylglycinamidine cyclo-ligase [Planctomycetota bacterium]|nr:MAG: phosphoribosylformylglycinamidine cyclo-ligase [Planctomycetota bacterium]